MIIAVIVVAYIAFAAVVTVAFVGRPSSTCACECSRRIATQHSDGCTITITVPDALSADEIARITVRRLAFLGGAL